MQEKYGWRLLRNFSQMWTILLKNRGFCVSATFVIPNIDRPPNPY
ncbi:hypothetical protein QUA81_29415 [Microcoleus sp. F6_B4]